MIFQCNFTNLLFMKSSHLQNVVSLLEQLQCQQLQLIIDRQRENVVKVYQGVPGFLLV